MSPIWQAAAVALAMGFTMGLNLGLYLGERGRRKDAQRREGVIRVDEPERATVLAPGDSVPGSVDAEIGRPPESFAREMRDEGYTDEEIQAEWSTLMTKAFSDTSGAPPG